MAWSVINTTPLISSSFGTTGSVALGFTANAGNTLLVGLHASSGSTTEITGLTLNTGQSLIQDFASASDSVVYYRYSNLPAGVSSLNYTSTPGNSIDVSVLEVSGLSVAAPGYTASLAQIDGYGTTHGFQPTIPAATDLVLGCFVGNGVSAISTSPVLTYLGGRTFYGSLPAGLSTVTATWVSANNASSSFASYAAAPTGSIVTSASSNSSFNSGRGSSFSSLLSF